MYTLYNSFTLSGQSSVKTWQQQGRDWAAYSNYRQQAAHGLYVPHTILNLVVCGEKHMYDGTRVHQLCAGDIFLIPAGSLICSDILQPRGRYSSINLVLPDDMIRDTVKGKYNSDGYTKSTVSLSRSRQWHAFTQLLLADFAQEGQVPAYHEVLAQALHLIRQHEPACRLLSALSRYPQPEGMQQLGKGIHEIRQLKEAATRVHMSTATLKRRFREMYNCSPMQWIWEKRLQMAAFLLRTTPYPVSEIAYSTGFDNITHFYRRFRAFYAVTPVQWRQEKN